jgi:hypothetical protein
MTANFLIKRTAKLAGAEAKIWTWRTTCFSYISGLLVLGAGIFMVYESIITDEKAI